MTIIYRNKSMSVSEVKNDDDENGLKFTVMEPEIAVINTFLDFQEGVEMLRNVLDFVKHVENLSSNNTKLILMGSVAEAIVERFDDVEYDDPVSKRKKKTDDLVKKILKDLVKG